MTQPGKQNSSTSSGALADPKLQFCSSPNQYARPAGLEKTGDIIRVHGYQEFSITPEFISPLPEDKPLLQKHNLVKSFFTPEFMGGKTMLDLGANGGFFSFLAERCGASAVTAVDLDVEYIRMMQAVTTLLGLERIQIRKTLVQDWMEEADVVVAFAMVHWLYSCTASYGSLDAVLGKLRSLSRQLLIVEWVAPEDPAIAMLQHTSWNSSIIREPYSQDAFEDALRRHFARVEIFGRTTPHRTLYIAWAQPHEVSLHPELPLLAPAEHVLSSRLLASCGEKRFFSRVYQNGETILKQASHDLACREKEILDRLDSDAFPHALSAEQNDLYSTVVLERIHGINFSSALPTISASPRSLASFFDSCLNLLQKLQDGSVLHRDIRADNILVRNGQPVLIDFGWAILDGKPYVTPPGLGDNGRPADGQFCDVFAMGKVFELACPRGTTVFKPLISVMTNEETAKRTRAINELKALLEKLPLPESWEKPLRFNFLNREVSPLVEAAPKSASKPAAPSRPHSNESTESLKHLASTLLAASQWTEASGVFQELCRRLPNDVAVWKGRIDCARQLGHNVMAKILLEEAIETHPDWAKTLVQPASTEKPGATQEGKPAAKLPNASAANPFQLPPASVAERMKREWNERASENARYFVRSTDRQQSEAEFDDSGRENVQTYALRDLPAIAEGRDPKTMTMLEIGCGVGRMTKHFANHFGQVHAIDVSGEMIRQANERLGKLPNATFHESSGADLALFSNEMFDLVFSFIVFQHIPDRAVVLNYIREAHRVLKPGGVFKFQVQGCTDPDWMKSVKDTWFGVTITEEDVDSLRFELGFDLLSKSGQGTQYSWYTLRKHAHKPAFVESHEAVAV